MNDEKRLEWKEKFDEWWANECAKGIKKTDSNPNGVAIGCNLYPDVTDNNYNYNPDGERRMVEQ